MTTLDDLLKTDEIFTHIDEDAGITRHFNATSMARFAEAAMRLRYIEIPLDAELAEYVRGHRGIEQWKLDRLCEPYLSRPIVAVQFSADDSVLPIDGNHRIVRRFELGLKTVRAVVFPEGEWERFLLSPEPEVERVLVELTKRG